MALSESRAAALSTPSTICSTFLFLDLEDAWDSSRGLAWASPLWEGSCRGGWPCPEDDVLWLRTSSPLLVRRLTRFLINCFGPLTAQKVR